MKEGSYSAKVHLSSPQNHLRWRRGLVNGQRVHLGLNTGQCALILGGFGGGKVGSTEAEGQSTGPDRLFTQQSRMHTFSQFLTENTFNSVVLPREYFRPPRRRIFIVSDTVQYRMFVNTTWYSAKTAQCYNFKLIYVQCDIALYSMSVKEQQLA